MPPKMQPKIVIKCAWITQTNEQCTNQCKPGHPFCGRHLKYEGQCSIEDIPNLPICSGCKNRFIRTNTQLKQCDKCHSICQKKNAKTKQESAEAPRCQGMTQQGNPCSYKCLKGDNYCQQHQSYKRHKQLIDEGHNVCKNWIRGCFAVIDPGSSSCASCRKKEQERENTCNRSRRELAFQHNAPLRSSIARAAATIRQTIHPEVTESLPSHSKPPTKSESPPQFMCAKCNALTPQLRNNKCLKCYDAYHKSENSRKERTLESKQGRHISECKKSAERRKIEWHLTNEEAIAMFDAPCHYCGLFISANHSGIDRIDSNGNYIQDNCVPCCRQCNVMKNIHSKPDFLDMVTYLLITNGHILQVPPHGKERYKSLFVARHKPCYSGFLADTVKRNNHCEVSEELYKYIVQQTCTYCKLTKPAKGIDRIDPHVGYIAGNITPCCKTCNMMKSSMTVSQFFDKLKKIHAHQTSSSPKEGDETQPQLSLSERIQQLCKNVKLLPHERNYHPKEYYDELTFGLNDGNNNLEAVKKIQIDLEFVKTPEQRDMWNYFRRYVSSFKPMDGSKLVGRQFQILVKDLTSQKYLGVISLSSDIYNMEKRDTYIGWTSLENKMERLSQILNITTCVPLQPFGHNFNGGKLMTALAFSLEVATQFHTRYGEHLLGITTMSLYGKSVQYDRLPFLKDLGFTKGYSVANIPPEVTRLCANFMKEEYNLDYPLKKKFKILMGAFDRLNISKEDYLMSNAKGIYFGFTCVNSKEILQSPRNQELFDLEKPIYNKYIRPASDILAWWIERWATQRFNHLSKERKLN